MTGAFQQFLTKLGNTSGRSATRRSGILHVPALVVLRRGIHHHHGNHANHVNGIRSKLHMNGSLSQTHAQTQTQTRSVFSYEDEDEDEDMMQQEKEQEQEVLTKQEIADMIADEHDLTNAKAQRIVKGIFDTIAEVRTRITVLYCTAVMLYCTVSYFRLVVSSSYL
jgi:hypothetical protein